MNAFWGVRNAGITQWGTVAVSRGTIWGTVGTVTSQAATLIISAVWPSVTLGPGGVGGQELREGRRGRAAGDRPLLSRDRQDRLSLFPHAVSRLRWVGAVLFRDRRKFPLNHRH